MPTINPKGKGGQFKKRALLFMNKTRAAWDHLKDLCFADPDFAWALHCNITMPIVESIGVSGEQANIASANVMRLLFDHDITTHPHFQYEKSGAQSYFEMRIEAEQAEEAQ